MTCEEIKEKLNEYLDGELSKEDTMDFEMHLFDCEECKKLYMAYKELGEAVCETKDTDLPEDFEIAIPKENKIVAFLKKHQKTAAVMAAAVALIFIARGITNMPSYVTDDNPPKDAVQQVTNSKEDSKAEDFEEAPDEAAAQDETAEEPKSETPKNESSKKKEPADKKQEDKKAQSAKETPKQEAKKEDVKSGNSAPALQEAEAAQQPSAQPENDTAAPPAAEETESTNAKNEAAPSSERADSASTFAAGAASYDSAQTEGIGSAPVSESFSNSAAKSAAPAKKAVDLSPVLSYSMPSADSFVNPDAYSALSGRLSSLKSRAASASDGEKQAILNEFYSLRSEISYNLK